jgi:binding-protein-dependent transport system inner membrane component
MAAYVAQRLDAVMVIMVAMSVLVFLATHALPSNAAALILGQYSTPETQAALEHKLGFDQPLPVQYWRWASQMLQGDMGQSFEMERPVAPILWDASCGLIQAGGEAGLTLRRVESVSVGFVREDFVIATMYQEFALLSVRYVSYGLLR